MKREYSFLLPDQVHHMDHRAINTRKEYLHKRMFIDAILIITGMTLSLFILFLIRSSGFYTGTELPFENWTIKKILLIITLLAISSWIFSFRRYMDIMNSLEEFNSIDAIKEEFISNLRHELKTPLVPIKGYSELMYDGTFGETNPKQKDALRKINISSDKLERIIDSLIFASAAKYGENEYTFTTIMIVNLITGASSELSEQLKQKGQELEINIQSGMSFLEGDKKYLREVLIQILENASKFSPPDTPIQIVAHEGYESLHIKITDSGIGIPEDEIENIFLRFYQIDGSKTRRYGGNGLGLHIAKTIVEAHKGNIWIESIPEKGTTVHVRLPTPKHRKKK